MISLKSILVPVDFTEPSLNALKYARALAGAFGSQVHVFHAIEDPAVYAWEVYSPPLVREDLEKNALSQLQQLLTAEEKKQFQAEFTVRIGAPFVEIIRFAKEKNTDLIIMGTHGRGAIAHLLLGSVAERVVRKAPCPVMTVRHPEHEFVLP